MNGEEFSIVQNYPISEYKSNFKPALFIACLILVAGLSAIFAYYLATCYSIPQMLNSSTFISKQVQPTPKYDDFEAYNGFFFYYYYPLEVLFPSTLKNLEYRFYIKLCKDPLLVENVFKYSKNLNKDFIFALIAAESNTRSDAVNINYDRKGEVASIDRGYFQLNSASYPELTSVQLSDPEINIKYGIAHIAKALRDNEGNRKRAIYAYNAGQSRVKNPPKSSILHAKRIIKLQDAIRLQRTLFIQFTY